MQDSVIIFLPITLLTLLPCERKKEHPNKYNKQNIQINIQNKKTPQNKMLIVQCVAVRGVHSHHGGDLVEALQELHDLGLVRGLNTGKAACVGHGVPLGGER